MYDDTTVMDFDTRYWSMTTPKGRVLYFRESIENGKLVKSQILRSEFVRAWNEGSIVAIMPLADKENEDKLLIEFCINGRD